MIHTIVAARFPGFVHRISDAARLIEKVIRVCRCTSWIPKPLILPDIYSFFLVIYGDTRRFRLP